MKKIILLALVLLSSVYVYANDERVFSDIPGSYAIYKDSRFKEEAIIGLCYVGDDSIIVRSYEPRTKKELVFLLNFAGDENEIYVGQDLEILKGNMNSSENAQRLIPMVINWSTSWYKSRKLIAEKERYSFSSDDDFNYLSYVPVFQIETIGNDGKFSLCSIGIIKDSNDERFFKFTKIPEPVDAASYKIPQGKDMEVTVDGLKGQLDSNWKKASENLYVLAKITPQDAAFFIETLNYKKVGFTSLKQFANFMLLASQDVVLLTEGSKIEFIDGSYFITSRLYDPVQNKITVQESQLIERNDGFVSIATVACYESLYLQNKDYFDKILH